MCSITGSFDLNKLQELIDLNNYRGVHSHSITVFEPGGLLDTFYVATNLLYQDKGMGPLELDNHDLSKFEDCYFLVHQQAPTTDSNTIHSIHPAKTEDTMLWHNGIIKAKQVEELQKKYNTKCTWDTMLMLKQINDIKAPHDIDGTFSCVMFDGDQLSLFRNEISPLFYDSKLNISTTKFDNSERVEPNNMYLISLLNNQLVKYDEFTTVENPYYFFK